MVDLAAARKLADTIKREIGVARYYADGGKHPGADEARAAVDELVDALEAANRERDEAIRVLTWVRNRADEAVAYVSVAEPQKDTA